MVTVYRARQDSVQASISSEISMITSNLKSDYFVLVLDIHQKMLKTGFVMIGG